jgi:hypothetical protein
MIPSIGSRHSLGRAARTPHKYRDWAIEENAMRTILAQAF